MDAIEFKCKRCGTCCNNLIEDYDDGSKKGLILTEQERKLFASENVVPHTAIGVGKPETIIFYQVTLNTCPHIGQDNERTIYEKRPLMCKEFPLDEGTYSMKCNVFSHLKGGPCLIEWEESQLEASEKLRRYVINRYDKYFKKGTNLWEFDLATKKWVLKRS